MVRSIFIEEDVDRVIELRVPQRGEDELVWILEASGKFSVRIAFHAQNVYYFDQDKAKTWQQLWNSKIHYWLKVIVWWFARGIVPTRERIQSFTNLVDISCPLCSVDEEIDLHIMAACDVTRILWFKLLGLHIHNVSFTNPRIFWLLLFMRTS